MDADVVSFIIPFAKVHKKFGIKETFLSNFLEGKIVKKHTKRVKCYLSVLYAVQRKEACLELDVRIIIYRKSECYAYWLQEIGLIVKHPLEKNKVIEKQDFPTKRKAVKHRPSLFR